MSWLSKAFQSRWCIDFSFVRLEFFFWIVVFQHTDCCLFSLIISLVLHLNFLTIWQFIIALPDSFYVLWEHWICIRKRYDLVCQLNWIHYVVRMLDSVCGLWLYIIDYKLFPRNIQPNPGTESLLQCITLIGLGIMYWMCVTCCLYMQTPYWFEI